jgi:S-adenosylmethionine:diacylglycerol 3-amino-3-carboxypropyl transferase
MQPAIGKVIIIYAWEDNCSITGVPLHIEQLVDLEAIHESMASLAQSAWRKLSSMEGIMDYFDVWHIGGPIGGGEITEARVK